MKRLTHILAILLAAALLSQAETNNVSVTRPANGAQSRPTLTTPQVRPVSSNLVIRSKVTYSGVAVQALRVDYPVQLLNPFASSEYGSGYENVVLNLTRTRPEGIALLSINF